MLYVTGVLLVVLGVCNAAAPSLGWYLLTRTLLGLPLQGIALVAFVLHVEWIGPDDRSIPGIMYSGFFAFGFSFLALFAYFIRHWRTLLLFISLLGLGCLLMTRCVCLCVCVCVCVCVCACVCVCVCAHVYVSVGVQIHLDFIILIDCCQSLLDGLSSKVEIRRREGF